MTGERYAKWTMSDGVTYNGQAHFASKASGNRCVACEHFEWKDEETARKVSAALNGNSSLSPHGYGRCKLQREMVLTQGRGLQTRWLFPSRAHACKYFQP